MGSIKLAVGGNPKDIVTVKADWSAYAYAIAVAATFIVCAAIATVR